MAGVELQYELDLKNRMPVAFEIDSQKSQTRWEYRGRQDWLSSTGPLMTGSLYISADGVRELQATYSLVKVTPLTKRPELGLPTDCFVLDEGTAEVLFLGQPKFDSAAADQLVEAATRNTDLKMRNINLSAECGPICVYFIHKLRGGRLPYRALKHDLTEESMAGLIQLANQYHMKMKLLHYPASQGLPKLPCIAHVAPSHFVVITKREGSSLIVLDPSSGVSHISEQSFKEAWTGYALCLES